ncbi:MAG: glycosyltransferase [Eubacterium sp.]|nr:glycosyltransferase [Eubacterium sp.]
MKILLVNKFHYIVGGSETYYFALKNLLEEMGHEVIEFSMKNENNLPSKYEKYFVEGVDYNARMGVLDKMRAAAGIIYSFEAKRKFKKLVKDTNPDIVHLHLFQHQISPSILDVIKEFKLPCVYTAHELKMICPNYKMLSHGKICEKCKGEKYINCLKNTCVKDSKLKSALSFAEGYVHKIRKSYDAIDFIITPSDFYKKKFEEFGVDEKRLISIPNFLDRKTPDFKNSGKSEHLYLGRLSEEKGIETLIDAIKTTDEVLNIVGGGALKESLEKKIKKENIKNVNILGFKSGQELIDIVGNAKSVILPSQWYENGPYSAIEALQMGIPVIGANIGGIPELIENNGYLFKPGDVNELREKILLLSSLKKDEYEKMKNASRQLFERKYTAGAHYPKLMKVYESACRKKELQ